MRVTQWLVCSAALSGLPSGVATAQAHLANASASPGAGAGRPAGSSTDVVETLSPRDAAEALRSNDPERVIAGVDAMAVLGGEQGVAPLVDLLHRGPTDAVTDHVVELLGIIGHPSAIEELSNLLHHRRPAVRQAAVQALAAIHDARVRVLLESALHDSDAAVRGEAAEALGNTGATASVPLLFRALERGVPEAAVAIGSLGDGSVAVSREAAHDREDPRTTTRPLTLAMWLGRRSLRELLQGYRIMLSRRDIPVAVKEQIIVRLEQQASAQIRTFLQEWIASLPAGYRGRDRARAELAIQQIHVPTSGGGR